MKDNFKGLENNEFASFYFEKGFGACDGEYQGIVKHRKQNKGFSIPAPKKVTKKAATLELDAVRMYQTIKAREEINRLMGF